MASYKIYSVSPTGERLFTNKTIDLTTAEVDGRSETLVSKVMSKFGFSLYAHSFLKRHTPPNIEITYGAPQGSYLGNSNEVHWVLVPE